jgi:type 1 fimbria pilin
MKKTFFLIALLTSFVIQSHAEGKPSDSHIVSTYLKSFGLGTKHVSGTLTLGPCTITYNGNITYTIIPPNITGFTGTITFGGGCKGTITVNGQMIHDGDIITNMDAEYEGDDEAIAFFKETSNMKDFLTEMNSLQASLSEESDK